MRKRIATCMAMACISSFLFAACENGGTGNSKNEVKVWTAPSYVKVLQDTDYSVEEEFSEYYANSELEISMFQNEKEGGQILITPSGDIKEYTVSCSDLKSAEGASISKEYIKFYNEKYVDVTTPSKSHTKPALLGMMPDALIPFDKAVEYNENKVVGGNNQGIYVEVDSCEAEAGVYSGTIVLTADDTQYSVPVSVTVWDMRITDENNLKTLFMLRDREMLTAEMDTSKDLYRRYYETLLDYRINLENIPATYGGLESEEEYISDLRKYFQDERVTVINFPECANATWTEYDADSLSYWFERLALLCFEDECNYYEKLVHCVHMLDEPSMAGNEHKAEKVVPTFKAFAVARNGVIEKLIENKSNYNVDEEFFNTVIEEMKGFEHVLTSSMRESYLYENNKSDPENPNESYIITWCPYMSAYDTESSGEAQRQDEVDEWWYGCNWPGTPNPTYHLDDRLLSARVLSWMAHKYDVTRNLYSGMFSATQQNQYKTNEPLENPYDATNLSEIVNGDGYIIYPGKPYELDCFVPSMRLMAIRDGMEDYEALLATEEKCNALASTAGLDSYDVDLIFQSLYSSLFSGTKMTGDSLDFKASRETLSQFASFAEKGLIITSIDSKMLSTELKIFASSGVVKHNGVEATYEQKANGKLYTIDVLQNQKANNAIFTLEQDGVSSEFILPIGGEKKSLSVKNLTYSGLKKNGNTVENNSVGESVSVKLGTAATDYQSVVLSGEQFKQLKSGIKTIKIEIENVGDSFTLECKYVGTKEPVVNTFTGTYSIERGTTDISIDVSALDWTMIGSIKELRLYVTYPEMKEREFIIKAITIEY